MRKFHLFFYGLHHSTTVQLVGVCRECMATYYDDNIARFFHAIDEHKCAGYAIPIGFEAEQFTTFTPPAGGKTT